MSTTNTVLISLFRDTALRLLAVLAVGYDKEESKEINLFSSSFFLVGVQDGESFPCFVDVLCL